MTWVIDKSSPQARGLVAAFPLSDDPFRQELQEVVKGRNPTYKNGTITAQPLPRVGVTGINFNQDTTYRFETTDPLDDFAIGTGEEITFSVWVRRNSGTASSNGDNLIAYSAGGVTSQRPFTLWYANAWNIDNFSFTCRNAANTGWVNYGSGVTVATTDNEWQHYVIHIKENDDNSCWFFKDGVELSSDSFGSGSLTTDGIYKLTASSNPYLTIGENNNGSSQFNGCAFDLRIYRGKFSKTLAKEIYQNPLGLYAGNDLLIGSTLAPVVVPPPVVFSEEFFIPEIRFRG